MSSKILLYYYYFSLITTKIVMGISSPIEPLSVHDHTIELEKNCVQLWWTVNEEEHQILFELHVKTTGWIALGISPAGGMKDADIAVSWVTSSGKSFIEDRFVFGKTKPMIDNTTQDWFLLGAQEKNGWTATQFKRAFDSCDPMDVPIKSGTNILIFAYGLVDPDIDITYHEERRVNKKEMTLGVQRTVDEMCSHTFSYYPFVDSLSACMSRINVKSWQMKMNTSLNITNNDLEQWMMNLTWTSQLAAEWQQFYDTAQRDVTIYRGNGIESKILPTLPKYKDLNIELCSKKLMNNNSLGNQSNASIIFENKFLLLVFVTFVVLSTGKWIA
ncbi:unnamed protein product [Adineta ricciae]|uniref:DOMON domain-containing protein n=1 Tax=Adineta ricciae TaxID=249248 RepID=A0A815EDB9_ADIRI|nr:unnamed protein product [Adineta ricciae]